MASMYERDPCHTCGHDHGHHEPHHDHHHRPPQVQYVPVHAPTPPPLQYEVPKCCEKGERGPQGYPGARGPQGQEGERGPAGRDGLDGQPGDTGPAGTQGIQGVKGDKGEQGDVGPQGEQGPQGIQGVKGDKGEQGDVGPQGEQGIQGIQGEKGDKGDTGDQGPIGLTGAQGIQGIQGDKGDTGDQGPIGLTGAQGIQGPSGMVSKTPPDEAGCFSITFVNQAGVQETCNFQECVTLLACGYTGTAICEAPQNLMLVEDTNVRKVYTFTYPSGLTGEITLEQTNQAATQFTVNSATVVGNDVCLNITTDGKVRYNAKYDKTALPTATLPGDTSGEFCSAPLEGILDINGLQWLGSQTQIQKEIGGQVTQTGFTQSDNTFDVVNGFAGATAWQDDTECVLYGGDSVNLIGSNFTGNIDAFANSLQTYDFCVEACYCQPVAVETDANGNILNAYDVNGNPVDPNTVTLL